MTRPLIFVNQFDHELESKSASIKHYVKNLESGVKIDMVETPIKCS